MPRQDDSLVGGQEVAAHAHQSGGAGTPTAPRPSGRTRPWPGTRAPAGRGRRGRERPRSAARSSSTPLGETDSGGARCRTPGSRWASHRMLVFISQRSKKAISLPGVLVADSRTAASGESSSLSRRRAWTVPLSSTSTRIRRSFTAPPGLAAAGRREGDPMRAPVGPRRLRPGTIPRGVVVEDELELLGTVLEDRLDRHVVGMARVAAAVGRDQVTLAGTASRCAA